VTGSVLDAAAALAPLLAEAAGAICRRHFRQPFEVIDKEDDSPVTIADRDAEAALRALIGEHFPDHGIVGEEHGTEHSDAEWVWTIDPIDGTGQFVSGVPLFGTLLSLVHRGAPVLGLIDQPILGERWLGVQGRPTTLNGTPISTRSCPALGQATVFATTPDMFDAAEAARFARVKSAAKRVRWGIDCYAYGLVAMGCIDAVVEAKLKPWDYCALVPVIEGAGGIATDWSGRALSLDGDGKIVAAGDARAHAAILERLGG
jgi:inositol-phosphate phosphatase/L-galactose 1-phosphate phosphatase/histidinol-phosphatase